MSVATDRELLEFAAKAAGYTTEHKWNAERLQLDPPVIALVVHENGELVSTGWNPLDTDGHALRLGAALRLHILHNDPGDSVLWVSAVLNKRGIHGVVEFQDEVQRADATRRAIVLAAAEIGRAMP